MSKETKVKRAVLYAGSQPYFVDLAKILMETHFWVPKIWLSYSTMANEIHSSFPETLVMDYISSVKGDFDLKANWDDLDPLCPDILRKLSEQQITALFMMERNDSNSDTFKYRERQEFYYYVLSYWVTKLKEHNIKMAIFEEEPHQSSDYILYLACEILGIEKIVFVRTINQLGILPKKSFDEDCEPLIERYRNLIETKKFLDDQIYASEVNKYFSLLNDKYEVVAQRHLWDQFEKLTAYSYSSSFISKSIYAFKKSILNACYFNLKVRIRLLFGGFESDQKEAGKTIFSSKLSYLSASFYKLQTRRKKKKLKKFYKSLAKSECIDGGKYIFCALQYQPEKSTSPLGGVFADQYLMIHMLSKCLPNGWTLLVKEHPSQFVINYTRYGEFLRSERYYQKIVELPNVQLVDLNQDVFDLIDNSQAVASVGGTICWEAAARGKLALSFGHSWFTGCEGIFHIQNLANLRQSIDKVVDGYVVDTLKVKAFAQSVYDLGLASAAIGGVSQLSHHNVSRETNAKLHAKAVNLIYPVVRNVC